MINPLVKAAPQLPKIPGNSAYRALQDSAVRRVDELAKLISSGALTAREWYDSFANDLADWHADAWVLGRQRSGVSGDRNDYDDLIGRALADQESQWLVNFYADLENGRYGKPGEVSEAAVRARSRLYAGKLRGTTNRAFVETTAPNVAFEWVLGGAEEHCSDCPRMAELGPWYRDTLAFVPGEGGTPCLTNCKCRLVRDDGVEGFRPVLLA